MNNFRFQPPAKVRLAMPLRLEDAMENISEWTYARATGASWAEENYAKARPVSGFPGRNWSRRVRGHDSGLRCAGSLICLAPLKESAIASVATERAQTGREKAIHGNGRSRPSGGLERIESIEGNFVPALEVCDGFAGRMLDLGEARGSVVYCVHHGTLLFR